MLLYYIYSIILVHIDDLLIKLVEMVLCYPAGSHDITPAESELDPSHMAIHLIKEVAQGNEMCQEILCKVINHYLSIHT